MANNGNMEKDLIEIVMEKTKPIFFRYEEINNLIYAPEVIADSRWYQALIREQKKIEIISKGYEELLLHTQLINELVSNNESENSDINEEITSLRTINEKLAMSLLNNVAFLGKEQCDDTSIKITGDIAIKDAISDIVKSYECYSKNNNWKAKATKFTNISSKTSVNINISGKNSYSLLKNEMGIFQIIDIKGNKNNVEVMVYPPKQKLNVTLDDKDIRIEVSHASGAGGQNVNKVATAIRAVHIPTNIATTCQDERSQYANKERAIKKLYEKVTFAYSQNYDESYKKSIDDCKNELANSGLIRKFDYAKKIVIDINSGLQIDLDKVVNGNIDEFIKLSLL
ncbi:MAG: peptide chain release factor-like protein [Clostridia bacterium]